MIGTRSDRTSPQGDSDVEDQGQALHDMPGSANPLQAWKGLCRSMSLGRLHQLVHAEISLSMQRCMWPGIHIMLVSYFAGSLVQVPSPAVEPPDALFAGTQMHALSCLADERSSEALPAGRQQASQWSLPAPRLRGWVLPGLAGKQLSSPIDEEVGCSQLALRSRVMERSPLVVVNKVRRHTILQENPQHWQVAFTGCLHAQNA